MKKLFFLAAAAVIMLAIALIFVKFLKTPVPTAPDEIKEQFVFYVFSGDYDYLKEIKVFDAPIKDKTARINYLFNELKKISESPVDENIRLTDIFINENICLLNLRISSENITRSAFGELSLFYSIVNTVIKNVPEISYVKFLINGEDVPYLFFDDYEGHIALDSFLKFNEELVK